MLYGIMHAFYLWGSSLGEQNYPKVETQFGQIKGLIAPNHLNPCMATNTKFDYD